MKTIQIIFLFLPFFLFSQKIENTVSKDTVYVFFNGKKKQKRTEYLKKINDTIHRSFLYSFLDENNKAILFFDDIYLSFDDRDNDKKAIKTEKKYCFFRKNKSKVLDSDFFLKNGIEESYNLLHRKFIFLVDVSEKKGKKYLLKEVRVSKSFEIE